jgi:hypothetical protein
VTAPSGTGGPDFLIDTCSVINLSYCRPVAQLFQTRYSGRIGWTRAVYAELVRLRTKHPPHPQAGRAVNWGSGWLGRQVEVSGEERLELVEEIRLAIALRQGSESELDHLGESASIVAALDLGGVRLISDDRGARGEASVRKVGSISTVGILAQLLRRNPAVVSTGDVDSYLDVLRANGRMHEQLDTTDLRNGRLGGWS